MKPNDGEGDQADKAESEKTSPYASDDLESRSLEEARIAAIENYGRIGSMWRWYDIPYRLMFRLSTGASRGLLPKSILRFLNRGMNFLYAFNDMERLRSMPLGDPLYHLVLPSEERIKVSGVWVVEFFPPSQFVNLVKSLERNGWDKTDAYTGSRGTQSEWVESARRKGTISWTRLATVEDEDSNMLMIDAEKGHLPEPFSVVSVTSIQIGTSLTAVVAFFRFKERDGCPSIDDVRRASTEPALVWRGLRRPKTLDPRAATQLAMHAERQRIHDLARNWMSSKVPGHFSHTRIGQPVLDLVLFDLFDPTVATDSLAAQDALAGLGVDAKPFERFSSPDVPGVCFLPAEHGRASRRLANSWTAVGRYATLEAATDSSGYGERPLSPRTLAYRYDVQMQNLLIRVGTRQYVQQTGETYSELFDLAHAKHRRFKPRENDRLARQLLATSLDLPLASKDISRTWGYWPGEIRLIGESELPPKRRWNALNVWGEAVKKSLDELIAMDETYRDVLATAASLTGTSQNTRIARWALLIAFASLIVAALALFVAQGAPPQSP